MRTVGFSLVCRHTTAKSNALTRNGSLGFVSRGGGEGSDLVISYNSFEFAEQARRVLILSQAEGHLPGGCRYTGMTDPPVLVADGFKFNLSSFLTSRTPHPGPGSLSIPDSSYSSHLFEARTIAVNQPPERPVAIGWADLHQQMIMRGISQAGPVEIVRKSPRVG